MNIYAIGDLHLSGNPPTKPMNIFGPHWDNHWQRIKEHWLSTVTDEDIIFLVGDMSWALRLDEALYDLKEIASLPGQKFMIRGNHDYWWESAGKLNRLDNENNMYYLYGTVMETENKEFAVCGTHGWISPGDIHYRSPQDDKPYRRELLRVERTLQEAEKLGCRHTVLLLHYPPVCDLTKPSGFTELLEKYKVPLCVFGHLHGMQPNTMFPRIFNGTLLHLVSADYRDCKLLDISEIMNKDH